MAFAARTRAGPTAGRFPSTARRATAAPVGTRLGDRPPARHRARKRVSAWSLCVGSRAQFGLEIGFYGREAVLHRADVVYVEARQRASHQILCERSQLLQGWRSFFSQIKTVGAPVGCIVASLDEAGGGQFVEQPPNCDRREVERLG